MMLVPDFKILADYSGSGFTRRDASHTSSFLSLSVCLLPVQGNSHILLI